MMQDERTRLFLKSFRSERAKSSWILQSSSKESLHKLLVATLKTLICPVSEGSTSESAEGSSVGASDCACPSCRRVSQFAHESLFIIKSATSSIGVESVRELKLWLGLRSIHKSRAVIVEEAHKMTASAYNALLKALEEPHESTFFFLLTDNVHSLASTIVSRCLVFRIPPASANDISSHYNWIKEIELGSQERVDRWQSQEFLALKEKMFALFSPTASSFQFAPQCKELAKELSDIDDFTELLSSITIDMWLISNGFAPRYHLDRKKDFEDWVRVRGLPFDFIQKSQQVARDWQGTIDKSLSLEVLLIDLNQHLQR
ncbi:MAG: hypothetical protein COT74_00020 [Bdellovibrionales bacterium CG10_big_fil_rev_8_21_14_0_10_45_34]|nr:MAG: hypothetical protein COT74_00020 [Bdellovibrionales bacterium CG10_big_fil_rev_8_21_14_0_10_45_34]